EKFINHELTPGEAQELLQWLEEDPTHVQQLQTHIKISSLLNQATYNFDTDDAYAKIAAVLQPVQETETSRAVPWKSILKYAAIFIGVIGIAFFTYNQFYAPINAVQKMPAGITLKMGSGTLQTLDSVVHKSIVNTQGKVVSVKTQNTLSYQETAPTQKLVYN